MNQATEKTSSNTAQERQRKGQQSNFGQKQRRHNTCQRSHSRQAQINTTNNDDKRQTSSKREQRYCVSKQDQPGIYAGEAR